MKKIVLLAMLIVLALTMVVACTRDEPPPTTEPPSVEQPTTAPPPAGGEEATTEPPVEEIKWSPNDIGPTTIRFAWWGGDSRHEAVENAIALFESRYPHITVEGEPSVFAGYLDALTVQLAAREEPDVFQSNYAWVYSLGHGQNVFANLYDYAHIIDLDQWSPELLEFTTTDDGQLAGVSHGVTGRVIVYDLQMLADFGLSEFPATFDEWIELGEKVAAANATLDAGENKYAFFPIGPQSLDIVMLTMLYNHTGKNLQENGQILFTVDEVEKMFDIWQRMIDTGTLPSWDQQEGADTVNTPVWIEGRGGSVFEWVSNIFLAGGAFNDQGSDDVQGLGVALLPAVTAGESRNSMQRTSLVHTISRNTANPELAAYFLNFLYTDEEALMLLGNEFGIPLSKKAAEISEREQATRGLQLEGLRLIESNVGVMCPLFEDPNLRGEREAAIEGFRTGALSARDAAERWVSGQQRELDAMN